MVRLAVALFAVQAGFHGFTASLPLALAAAGVPDPEIGLVVGAAALVQLPAAFLVAGLVDRFGGVRLFRLGAVAYVLSCGFLLLPGVEPGGSLAPFAIVRAVQGVGIATALPSALSLVAGLVPPARQGFGLAFVGSAHNLTLVALPPLSIVILGAGSLRGVALAVAAIVAVGALLTARLPLRSTERSSGAQATGRAADPIGPPAAPRRLGVAYRASWAPILAIVLLYVAHWGAISAYLPQRAAAAGADIGLFFVADGLAIFALRVPSGWLADRVQARWLALLGIVMTAAGLALLLPVPTTPALVVSGALGGAGGGLILTPLLLELSRRSGDADRGSAFSLFSGALAGAILIGSIGGVPILASVGFAGTKVAGIAALGAAAAIVSADRGLARQPGRPRGAVPAP